MKKRSKQHGLSMASKRKEEQLFGIAIGFLEDLGLDKEEMREIQTEGMTITEFFIAANKRLLELTVNGKDENYELAAELRDLIPRLETIRAKQAIERKF